MNKNCCRNIHTTRGKSVRWWLPQQVGDKGEKEYDVMSASSIEAVNVTLLSLDYINSIIILL